MVKKLTTWNKSQSLTFLFFVTETLNIKNISTCSITLIKQCEKAKY